MRDWRDTRFRRVTGVRGPDALGIGGPAALAGDAGDPGGAGGVYCSQAFSRATTAARSDETAFESRALGGFAFDQSRSIKFTNAGLRATRLLYLLS